MTRSASLLKEQQQGSTAAFGGLDTMKQGEGSLHEQGAAGESSTTFSAIQQSSSRKSMQLYGNLCDFGIFELTTRRLDASSRSVSFAQDLITTEVDHPFVVEDIASAQWYDKDELQTIRTECEKTVDILKNDGNGVLPEEEFCKRGLEAYFRKDLSSLRRTEEIRNDVLDAQVDLWCSDRTNSMEDLAEIYSLHSTQYAIKALVTGLHDWKSLQDLDQESS